MTVQSDQFDLSQPAEDIFEFVWQYANKILDLEGQITFFVLLIIVLVLFVLRIYKDKLLWGKLLDWLRVSIGGVIGVTLLLYISPYVLPDSDPFALYRVLILRAAGFLLALILLAGGIMFIANSIFKGVIQKVEQAAYGPTAVVVSIVLGLCYLMSYS